MEESRSLTSLALRIWSALRRAAVPWLGEGSPTLLVRVTDASGGPVAHARVLLAFVGGDPDHPYVIGRLHGATGPDGTARFTRLSEGTYVVSVSAEGYLAFGDAGDGARLPTGTSVVVGAYREGAGPSGKAPLSVTVPLRPRSPERPAG